MSRTYIAYVNDRKAGLTWGALVGASLILLNKTCSPMEVALHIWGKANPPHDLYERVKQALEKGCEKGFFTKLKRGTYAITLLGNHVFSGHMNSDLDLRRQSDSILFNTQRPKKSTRKVKRAGAR